MAVASGTICDFRERCYTKKFEFTLYLIFFSIMEDSAVRLSVCRITKCNYVDMHASFEFFDLFVFLCVSFSFALFHPHVSVLVAFCSFL